KKTKFTMLTMNLIVTHQSPQMPMCPSESKTFRSFTSDFDSSEYGLPASDSVRF
ncbi:hypothetical protein A2U01_0046953, partial [Trifolium medium]|nr:hypothetical protein [Trifolium medium]